MEGAAHLEEGQPSINPLQTRPEVSGLVDSRSKQGGNRITGIT